MKALGLTGNPTEKDFIQAATALYNYRLEAKNDTKAIYTYFGDDGANPGTPFIFVNCHIWLKDTSFWTMIEASY